MSESQEHIQAYATGSGNAPLNPEDQAVLALLADQERGRLLRQSVVMNGEAMRKNGEQNIAALRDARQFDFTEWRPDMRARSIPEERAAYASSQPMLGSAPSPQRVQEAKSEHVSNFEHGGFEKSESLALGQTSPAIGNAVESTASHTMEPRVPVIPAHLRNSARYMALEPNAKPVAKSSLPRHISLADYSKMCLDAAAACRLPPYVTTPEEAVLLQGQSMARGQNIEVTYLQIRNAICYMWIQNPLLHVTRVEAQGAAKEERLFQLAGLAWDFLSRHGYINYGCLSILPDSAPAPDNGNARKTIVVVGAGVAGLACARQLQGLFAQHAGLLMAKGEPIPQVLVVESRNRIGGRVYSYRLATAPADEADEQPYTARNRVDLGAQIVTGFENGNPINILLRRQLGQPYHTLHDPSITYDVDGSLVDAKVDRRVDQFWNYVLDIVSVLKTKANGANADGASGMRAYKPSTGSLARSAPSIALSKMGFEMSDIVREPGFREPEPIYAPSLGESIVGTVEALRSIIVMTPLELRLLNWHMANLEYANCTTLDSLSLQHWDQDDGNEFRGPHATVYGGYGQVPRGLALAPKRLNLALGKRVVNIDYADDDNEDVDTASAVVTLSDNTCITASAVVCTLPLGVLKHGYVGFFPPLPEWKQDSIKRLGFGSLNKVVLVFPEKFWSGDADFINVLHEGSSMSIDNRHVRGRFYQFWDCTATAGRPVLTAFMAGEAAIATEEQNDNELVGDAMMVLRRVHANIQIPAPIEVLVTRWGKDPNAFGSYSYVAQGASGDDYDNMMRRVGLNLYFAGEGTCRKYPATVHGAYISGLRAAEQVFEQIAGPIEVPDPLIPRANDVKADETRGAKRKYGVNNSGGDDDSRMSQRARYRMLKSERLERQREAIEQAIREQLGERPAVPQRPSANPFLLYQKMEWHTCKAQVEQEIRAANAQDDAAPPVSKNDIRARLGRMWRNLTEEERKPWLDSIRERAQEYESAAEEARSILRNYEAQAEAIRTEMQADFDAEPPPAEEERARRLAEAEG